MKMMHMFQLFLGIAASLVYILAMELKPRLSPERKRLPVEVKNSLSVFLNQQLNWNPKKLIPGSIFYLLRHAQRLHYTV